MLSYNAVFRMVFEESGTNVQNTKKLGIRKISITKAKVLLQYLTLRGVQKQQNNITEVSDKQYNETIPEA